VLLWLDVFRPAGLAVVVASPLPAVLSGVLPLLAYGVGVAGVQVRSCPVGPVAQEPCFETGEGQESVDPQQDYRCDDDVLPPQCESPLAEDVPAVLPEAVVAMHTWVGSRHPRRPLLGCSRADLAAPEVGCAGRCPDRPGPEYAAMPGHAGAPDAINQYYSKEAIRPVRDFAASEVVRVLTGNAPLSPVNAVQPATGPA